MLPLLKAIKEEKIKIPISIDTFYSEVARQAAENGANLLNDTTGGTFDRCNSIYVHVLISSVKCFQWLQREECPWC